MKNRVQLAVIAGAIVFLAVPAAAQMTISKPSTHSMHPAPGMMPECDAMMKEFMADPIVQKRMMSIMQKHMMQHSGQASMMESRSAAGESSAHDHHPVAPVAAPTGALPMPSPS